MPAVYVLDVPEFAGMVSAARGDARCRVSGPRLGYVTIEADGELVFDRRAAGFKPAVWYGAFTGGVTGRIVEFGRDTVRILDDEDAS